MKLTDKALEAISERMVRIKLALHMRKTEQTVINYIRNNDPTLTQAGVLKFIETETGLKPKQILTDEEIEA